MEITHVLSFVSLKCSNRVDDSAPEAIDIVSLLQTLKSLLLRNKVEVPAGKSGRGRGVLGANRLSPSSSFPLASFLSSSVHHSCLFFLFLSPSSRVQPFGTIRGPRTSRWMKQHVRTQLCTAHQYRSSARES